MIATILSFKSKAEIMTRTHTLKIMSFALSLAAAVAVSGCADMGHMKKKDIPTDQNPAHDMHKTPGT
jgi:hypothetical protein